MGRPSIARHLLVYTCRFANSGSSHFPVLLSALSQSRSDVGSSRPDLYRDRDRVHDVAGCHQPLERIRLVSVRPAVLASIAVAMANERSEAEIRAEGSVV